MKCIEKNQKFYKVLSENVWNLNGWFQLIITSDQFPKHLHVFPKNFKTELPKMKNFKISVKASTL